MVVDDLDQEYYFVLDYAIKLVLIQVQNFLKITQDVPAK